ncbi:MAG: AFG1 family ATPase [Candidatus Azosocius agrarius]|nr:MAG: AFG1 family ATPase [Gammaproteobacteria bacterium]
MKVGEILKNYNLDVLSNKIIKDEKQIEVITVLQSLYNKLCKNVFLKDKLYELFFINRSNLKFNIYLWGDVGRGKTYLVNLFFETLTIKNKLRLHFHSFMYRIHNELSFVSGSIDPLDVVAKRLSLEYKIICLDEFFVSDIADAMLLGRLIEKLLFYKVYFVINSNLPPEKLYENGLQRQHFIKTIELIKLKFIIINIDNFVDYRVKMLKDAGVYHKIDEDNIDRKLLNLFIKLSSSNELIKNSTISILNRNINFIFLSGDVIWFDFHQLCSLPRSQNDYIEIAKIYHTVFITNIPILHEVSDSQVRRFIALIDEFYDRNVKIVITTFVDIENIYSFYQFELEFKRTLSRLIEMKSVDYFSKKHKN